MKAIPITRIAVSLTVEEARAATINATDLQLALVAALRQIEPPTVVQMIAEHKARKQLAAPKKNGHQPAAPRNNGKPHEKPALRECPVCHAMKSPMGFRRHVAACERAALAAQGDA